MVESTKDLVKQKKEEEDLQKQIEEIKDEIQISGLNPTEFIEKELKGLKLDSD